MPGITICPEFEYTTVVGYDGVLSARSRDLFIATKALNNREKLRLSCDTRIVHSFLFAGLTPAGHPYYAGHYRGESFLCLIIYTVGVKGDKNVGHAPITVPQEMRDLRLNIERAVRDIALTWQINAHFVTAEMKLIRVTEVIASIFVYFLEIHPYANGNGHMARLILVSLFGIFGIYFRKWPIHPRPADPPYTDAIAHYRLGNRDPLRQFLLSCI
jgi:hypothetical protein